MKKIFYSLIVFLLASLNKSNAQYWQATLVNDGTKLHFIIKPVGGDLTNFQFDGMEFFVRKPSADAATTFGAITNNTANFPGLDITKGGGGADFLNGYGTDAGYDIYYFYGKSVSATTSPVTYTNGVEYEVFNVEVTGGVENFEFAADNSDSEPYYLTLSRKSDPGGQPDYTATGSRGEPNTNVFYGPGTSQSGTNYYQKPGLLLPVKFLSFYALKSGDAGKLTWTVNDDANNEYFDVERSMDGKEYKAVSRVNAMKNGSAINTYTSLDPVLSKLGSKVLYYRIKQLDKNGTTTYSAVRLLNVDAQSAMSIYPNPARTVAKLIVDAPQAGKAAIIVRDNQGRQLQLINTQLVRGINQKDINVTGLPSGEYHVSVVSDNLNQSAKLTKVN